MARKFDLLNELYDTTVKRLSSPAEWRAFLESACRNYRLRFDEQLLVFAQRPDATAVLEIERWNTGFGRWVNRGAKGIAVFENAQRDNQRLKYYFDISDTHESRLSRPVPLWQMKDAYTEDVVDTLESNFGYLESKSTLEDTILSASNNAVEDNVPDYVGDLLLTVDDSLLYGISQDTVTYMYNNLMTQSVAYMMMTRLGMDASLYYSDDDFRDIVNFSTPAAMNALGYATSDIAEMALSEISKTVLALDRENRTFVNPQRSGYNNDTKQPERRIDNGDHLHPTGRLQSAQPDSPRTAEGGAGRVRSTEAEIPADTAQDPLLQSPDLGEADTAPRRHRTDSAADGGQPRPTDGAAAGRDGGAEGTGSDDVGTPDEQHPSGSEGDRSEQGDLHRITPDGQTQSEDEPALSLSTTFGLADRIYDYLTDYIINFYEEADGEPLEVAEDGSDPVIVARIEHDLNDPRILEEMIDYFDGQYERFDNDEEINQQYDLIMKALQDRLISIDDRFVSGDRNFGYYDVEAERDKLPFFGVDRVVNEIFATTPYLNSTLEEIGAYLESVSDPQRRRGFMRLAFNDEFTELILSDDTQVGYKTYENGILIWKGSYPSREGDRFLGWDDVVGHFDAMRKLGMLHTVAKPLPSVGGQQQLIEESAGGTPPPLSFSQEIIDEVLTRGSGVSQGKMRIYEQFQKSLSRDENIRFLKNEYGIGGASDAVPYTGITEMHDGKGIELSMGFDPDRPRQLLKWNYVEKRIRELISLDRYLNDKEKEIYPSWLEQEEQRRIETEEAIARREEERQRQREIETAPEERRTALNHYEYRYHLGDTVYIGSTGYELLSIDDDRVMLFDPKFPLFNKEMPRAEFESKVQENPLNNHLRVEVQSEDKLAGIDVSTLTPLMQTYVREREAHPNMMILFQVGDFMEAYGQDAITLAEVFGLAVISRSLTENQRIEMIGFPSNRLETYLKMVTDRGYQVGISRQNDDGSRDFLTMAPNQTEPVLSLPIARLDYYRDGEIEHSIEYFDADLLQRDIRADITDSSQMGLVVYTDENGGTIDYGFVNSLPKPLVSVTVAPTPPFESEYNILLKEAKRLIDEYCIAEFGDPADYGDLSDVGLAYVQTEDGLHEIQVSVDLLNCRIIKEVDGKVVHTDQYDSLSDLIEKELRWLDFGELTDVSEEEMAPFYEQDDDFPDVNPAEIRRNLESRGIVNGQLVDPEKLDADPFVQQVYADAERAAQEDQEQTEEVKLHSVVVDLTPNETDGTNSDLIGQELTLDERRFKITKVNAYGDVSMEDLTFQSETGFPVVRIEKVDFVRRALEAQRAKEQEIAPTWERQPRAKAQTFDLHPDVPMSQRYTFDLKAFELEEVGKKARFRRSIEAIHTLKACEAENRFATPDEQRILAQYVGWGGIPEAFDENNDAWTDEYSELRDLLSSEEYASARASTLTAFYTPPVVINAIYKLMENMGFQRGNILEPSCGIGNFIGMLPDSMSESRVFGVEIDTISAGIAQQLYQKSSVAAQPYEKAEIPDSFFDAVVGNVPFGDFGVQDKRYDKHHFMIHDYFFAKSLDKLRPGGVMALVTSRGTMDKESAAVRKYIAQRADLLGAIRLPNNTFKGNAGTDVVSDILILQKRDRIIDIEPSWVHLDTDENGVTMNSYFVEHPEMILGEMKMVSGRFGMTPDCIPYEDADLSELLDEAVSNIHGEVTDYELEEGTEEDFSIPADPSVRNFSFTLVDDTIYFRENSRMIPIDVSTTAQNRIRGMIPIRDCVRRLLEMQTENYPDEAIREEQEQLNTLYDNYTKKYGLISSRANNSAFSMDSSYSLISSLEVLDEEGNLERKADIFTKRTIRPHEPITSVDTASEALAVSMAERARVDMAFMSELSGLSEEELFAELKGVIFLNPLYGNGSSHQQKYLTADEYLSGNVREKLRIANQSAQLYLQDYTVNVEALEKVQPEDLKASEISVRLGATWLPVEDVQNFIFNLLETPYYARWRIKVHYSPITGEWNIENKTYDRTNVKAYSTYGTDRINAYQIIEQTLNLKDVRIHDYIEEPDGKKKAVLNKKETAIALAKQEQIKQQFQEWIWADPARRERLCRLYNDKFNNTRPREYDGSHIDFVGMNPEIELREHQRNAVAHILYGGNTLLAHEVGAGKTFAMTAAAMESKRLGLCNKSLFVVPNHLTEQWAAEFLQLYPAANILVATKKDFERKNRRRFCARIATGDYDAVIIGHSQFEKIPISIERQIATLQMQLDEITDGIESLSRSREDKYTVKQLEKTRRSIENKLEKLNAQDRKDDVVTFEELGVDRLFVDESHFYKNRAKRCA